MNHTTRPSDRTSRNVRQPYARSSAISETGSLEALIDDTIQMIENTQKFIGRLEQGDSRARVQMEETAKRLERSLRSLRQRRHDLGGHLVEFVW